MLTHKGYTGVIEFDPELKIFTGHVIDIAGEIYFEGTSVDELEANMKDLIDDYLVFCEKRGEEPDKPFSGQLRLRFAPDLHRKAASTAAARGVSLNTLIESAVAREVAT